MLTVRINSTKVFELFCQTPWRKPLWRERKAAVGLKEGLGKTNPSLLFHFKSIFEVIMLLYQQKSMYMLWNLLAALFVPTFLLYLTWSSTLALLNMLTFLILRLQTLSQNHFFIAVCSKFNDLSHTPEDSTVQVHLWEKL